MSEQTPPQSLIDFPCIYEFKAFGPAGDQFVAEVKAAVGSVVSVGQDAMKSRLSGKGIYQCVTVVVRLANQQQLSRVYSVLKQVDDLKYLL